MKCFRLNHARMVTTSSSIMAMWAAGPPKATKPSLRNSRESWTSVGFAIRCNRSDSIVADRSDKTGLLGSVPWRLRPNRKKRNVS